MSNNDCIFILGGDGFCGWPTSLYFSKMGYRVVIIDNLIRRRQDDELNSSSLIKIYSIEERLKYANNLLGSIEYINLDIAKDYVELKSAIEKYNPTQIIHFAEQRSAPYSMIDEHHRIFTINNNISGTNNILNAIIETDKDIHLIHLGTMGVYGYNDNFGEVPEGYLDIIVEQTKKKTQIVYPQNPGSIYHLSKCLDHTLFQFYAKNWGIKITDLHQGIVWGVNTTECNLSPYLSNRLDYDGIFGTVLNRFIIQAARGFPLSVYGTGGQTRAFIHISDTVKCIYLAAMNPNLSNTVRVFNQVAEERSVKELAQIVSKIFGCKIEYLANPRNELAQNNLIVKNKGLKNLGFNPIILSNDLINTVFEIVNNSKINVDMNNINNSPNWT